MKLQDVIWKATAKKISESLRRAPMDKAEDVPRLYREVYSDLNMRHFHETEATRGRRAQDPAARASGRLPAGLQFDLRHVALHDDRRSERPRQVGQPL